MLLTIEFVVLLSWVIYIFGFIIKRDYTITSLASLNLMVLGLIIITDGSGIPYLITLSLGATHIGVGFYTLMRGGTETYQGKSFNPEPLKNLYKKIRRKRIWQNQK